MKRVLVFACVISFVGVLSCEKRKFKRSDFLVDLYDHKIEPDFSAAAVATDVLFDDCAGYVGAPGTTTLETVRGSFKTCLTSYERVAFYNLGDISAVSVYNAAYKTTIDTVQIWENYSMHPSFTSDIVSGFGNQSKGIFCIEYLLFSNHAQDSLASTKYHSFVSAQVSLLVENFGLIKNAWATYESNFTENTDDGVEGSYNIIINRIVHLLEDIIDKRINKPLDASDIKLAVGHRSGTAWKNIKTLVTQINDVYKGNGDELFHSIANNVRKKNKKLAEEIDQLFTEIQATGDAMNEEMAYYISTGSAELIAYKEKLKELLVLFKLDVVAELDIVLTFGDNDGD